MFFSAYGEKPSDFTLSCGYLSGEIFKESENTPSKLDVNVRIMRNSVSRK